MIPGSNLLKMALSVISRQQLVAYQFASRTLNAIGQYDVTYSSPIMVSGSFQPVPRGLEESLRNRFGLDFARAYYTFYTDSVDLIDIQRDSSGDKITFGISSPTIEGSSLLVTLGDLQGITDGSFTLTIGSTTNLIQSLDFSSATSFYDCALIIQLAINSKVGDQWFLSSVDYSISTNSFIFVGGDTNTSDSISVSAGTVGTDISSTIGWFPQSITTKWISGVNQTYQVISANDWWAIDKWTGVICAEVEGPVD